jgi:hypothetical protein
MNRNRSLNLYGKNVKFVKQEIKATDDAKATLVNTKKSYIIKNQLDDFDERDEIELKYFNRLDSSCNKTVQIIKNKNACFSDNEIDYGLLKSRRTDQSVVIKNKQITNCNEELWPIAKNYSKQNLTNSSTCEVLNEEKVTVL